MRHTVLTSSIKALVPSHQNGEIMHHYTNICFTVGSLDKLNHELGGAKQYHTSLIVDLFKVALSFWSFNYTNKYMQCNTQGKEQRIIFVQKIWFVSVNHQSF